MPNDQWNGPTNKYYPRGNIKNLPIGAADKSIDEENSSNKTPINRNVDLGKSEMHNKFLRDHHKNYLGFMSTMG